MQGCRANLGVASDHLLAKHRALPLAQHLVDGFKFRVYGFKVEDFNFTWFRVSIYLVWIFWRCRV